MADRSFAGDIVFVRDLQINAVIGIYDWERRICQTLRFDLEMGTDVRKAAASDDIADALNYKAVSKRVIEFVSASEYQLVEALAEAVAKLLMTEFELPWLRLSVNKLGAVRGASGVGVTLQRFATDYA